MPLTLLKPGEARAIASIGGKEEARRFLGCLGFVVGSPVTVVAQMNGNVIVSIKQTRVAISKEMASRIQV